MLLTLLSCYKLNRCYIKLSLVNILENVFVFIELLFKILLFKRGVLIYAEHCIYIFFFSSLFNLSKIPDIDQHNYCHIVVLVYAFSVDVYV